VTHPDDDGNDALFQRLRAADPLADPRWDALADGTLPEDEAAELKTACERGDAPAGAYEVFQPMSPERREKLLAAVLGPDAPAERGEAPVPVSPWRRRAFVAACGLALAASVALAVRLRTPTPLPSYTISFEGADTVRTVPSAQPATAPPRALHLRPGARARILLIPASATGGDVEVRAFVVLGGEAAPWDAGARITKEGAVEIPDVSAERLRAVHAERLHAAHAPEGDVVVAVARAGRWPGEELLRAGIAAGAGDAGGARLLRLHVLLDEAPP
jgi:hypothetical protein